MHHAAKVSVFSSTQRTALTFKDADAFSCL